MNIKPNDYEAVLIGNPDSIFVKMMASYWLDRGISTVVITRSRQKDINYNYPFDVLFSEDFEGPILNYFLCKFEQKLKNFEKFILKISQARIEKTLGPEKDFAPLFLAIVIYAISISRLVRKLKPKFIFGQEAYAYGLSVALCQKLPKAIMPWGGDIYLYAHTSFITKMIVTYALRHVDLIFPGSVSSVDYIAKIYKINPDKIKPMFWGVDLKINTEISPLRKQQILKEYNIKSGDLIIMNVRRLMPLWGYRESLKVFIEIGKKYKNVHFIMLGGGKKEYFIKTHAIIKENNLQDRFTIFENDIEYSHVAELMSISDIFVSLMLAGDMRSSSIMLASYICGVPVITDNEEFRLIKRNGFKAMLVNPRDENEVFRAIEKFINSSDLRAEFKKKNREYIFKFEDYDKQMMEMLSHINNVCEKYNLTISYFS